jgi:two-component system NarL family response regulator
MTSSGTISILIADDHPIVRGGLEAMLCSEKKFVVLGCMASGKEVVQFCQEKGIPDVLVMDIRMPEMDGFQTYLSLKRIFPNVRVLFLAGMPLKHEEQRARELGACGYLSKCTDQDEIVSALHKIVEDSESFISEKHTDACTGASLLTAREREVLEYLSRGHNRESIAKAMNIAPETVKSHMKSIYTKLDVSGSAEAVGRGYELGLLRA